MKINGPPARRRNLVSITPLVDVVFILLFFFMLASSFDRWQGIDLTLVAAQAPAAVRPESLVLPVRSGAEVQWRGAWLDEATLVARLAETDPALVLILKPAQGAAIQDLIRVLESIRAQGRNRVSLAVAK